MKKTQSLMVALVAAFGLMALTARATISYSVDDASVSFSGNTITLGAYSGNVNLAPPASGSVVQKLNSVTWNPSFLVSDTSTKTISRDISITVNTGTYYGILSQKVDIDVGWIIVGTKQELTIKSSSPIYFNWTDAGLAYTLAITALEYKDSVAFPELACNQYGELMGEFKLTSKAATTAAVPEPTTVMAGALLLLPLGVSAIRVLRKKA